MATDSNIPPRPCDTLSAIVKSIGGIVEEFKNSLGLSLQED